MSGLKKQLTMRLTHRPGWPILLSVLLGLVFSTVVSADGPNNKSFAYNALKPDQFGQTVEIPFLAKNFLGQTSTLVVANQQGTGTDLQIEIYYPNGESAVPSIKVDPFPGYGVHILNLASVDGLADGRYHATVVSAPTNPSASTKIATEVHTESAHMGMSYTSIGTLEKQLIIPIIEKRADHWNTTFYVQNTARVEADLTIHYYADTNPTPNPTPVLTKSNVRVPRFGSLEFASLAETDLPDGFTGYAQISADQPIGAVVIRQNYFQEAAMIYPAARSFVSQPRLSCCIPDTWLIPFVTKQSPRWGSSILQTQTRDDATAVTTIVQTLYNSSGDFQGSHTFYLNANALNIFKLDNLSFLSSYQGSVVSSSDGPVWSLVKQDKPTIGDLFGYLTDGEGAEVLHLPYVSSPKLGTDWRTSINIQNAVNESNTVLVTFYSLVGRHPAHTETVQINKFGSHLLDVSTVFPAGFEGRAVITSLSGGGQSAVVVGDKQQPAGNHARVIKDGLPRANVRLFHNGQALGQTDAEGLLSLDTLTIGNPLIALDPVYTQPTARKAHDGWAYRVHTTNLSITADGTTTPGYLVTATGPQILTTSVNNTLILFNLVVSVEWDATEDYLVDLQLGLERAADYLYDVTDGQMTFGQVAIYDNAEHWTDADIQISAKNIVRPHAYIGGLTDADASHVIRLGRFWDGNSGNQGAWSAPAGYRTLVHEFGHYALGLYDEYFGYKEVDGDLTGRQEAFCTGPENRNPENDATNGSMMDHQYTASELVDSSRWSAWCQGTVQQQLSGEADWETLLRLFGDSSGQNRWHLISPDERAGLGRAVAGPESMPDSLPLPTITYTNSGQNPAPIQLQVTQNDVPYRDGALVSLYFDGKAIDQGMTDGCGRLTILGADNRVDSGDELRLISPDGVLSASKQMPLSGPINLDGATRHAANNISGEPYLRLWPSANVNGELTGIQLVVDRAEASAHLFYALAGADHIGQTDTLSYDQTEQDHRVTVNFIPTAQAGFAKILGLSGGSDVNMNVDYRLQQTSSLSDTDLFSNDGNLNIHFEAGSLSLAKVTFLIASPWGLPGVRPAGLDMIGEAYEVTASNGVVGFEQPAVLRLSYDAVAGDAFTDLAIYRWDFQTEVWEDLASEIETDRQEVVTSITRVGLYALLGKPTEGQSRSERHSGVADDCALTTYLPLISKD